VAGKGVPAHKSKKEIDKNADETDEKEKRFYDSRSEAEKKRGEKSVETS
jgi:hypothetical protein